MNRMLTELLPQSLDCERFLLGSVLTSDHPMHTLRNLIETSDFALHKHMLIWAAMCEIYDAGGQVDRITLYEELQRRRQVEAVDGLAYLCDLGEGIPAIADLSGYVRTVKDKVLLRRLAYLGESIKSRAMDATENPQELLDSLGQSLIDLAPSVRAQRPISAHDLVEEFGLDKLLSASRCHGLKLPWPRLDFLLCGLQPEQLIILAADTSFGKTSMALQIAAKASEETGVAVFSLEMEPERLFRRMVNQIARLDWDLVRHGTLGKMEREKQRLAAFWITEHPIWFDEQSFTTAAIHAAVRKIRVTHPVGLIVVDYLQLLQSVGRTGSRAQEVSAQSREMKQLAQEFHTPLLLLSQFSREGAKEGRKRTLHDLKESGDVECNADAVLIIQPEKPEGCVVPVNLNIAKQREGPRFVDVPMWFYPHFQAFEERAREKNAEGNQK